MFALLHTQMQAMSDARAFGSVKIALLLLPESFIALWRGAGLCRLLIQSDVMSYRIDNMARHCESG